MMGTFFAHLPIYLGMKLSCLTTRRLGAWLLVLVLLCVTLPSGASWRCLNGTPCPPNCPMLRGKLTSAPTGTCVKTAHCSLCPTTAHTLSVLNTGSTTSCTTPQCVLRIDSKPDSTLTTKQIVYLPLLALPPPIMDVPVVVVEPRMVLPPTVCLLPQRFFSPHLGRSPPTFL